LDYSLNITAAKKELVQIKNFHLETGKITFLFGESGIGKSLIAKAIFGLIDSDALRVRINNQAYRSYIAGRSVARLQHNGFFVFQEPSSHLNPLETLRGQLTEGRLKRVPKREGNAALQKLWQFSDNREIKDILAVYPKPYRPSGGEKQRILLSMAFRKLLLYQKSPPTDPAEALYVFDEPSGSLDNTYRDIFIQMLFEQYGRRPFTGLVITHDYSMINELEKYLGMMGAVELSELQRNANSVFQKPFLPHDYKNWLNKQHGIKAKTVHSGHNLLSLQSGLCIHGRRLAFHKGNVEAPPTDLKVNRGEITYLKARSGAGKTTVAKVLMGLYRADVLRLQLGRKHLSEKSGHAFWRRHIWGKMATMVFQHADEALNLNSTVLETFRALSGNRRVNRAKVLRRINEFFEPSPGQAFLDKPTGDLSGGQKQRINIMRSMVLNTDLLILDEPLNGLDLISAGKVLDKIRERQSDGAGILLISHNEEIFDRIAPVGNRYYLKEMEP